MTELANPRLAAWETFYVIVGSSGAGLIGIHNAWDTVTYVVVAGVQGHTTNTE